MLPATSLRSTLPSWERSIKQFLNSCEQGQNKVSESWRGFLTEKGKSLSKEDWQMAVDFLFKDLPTADYGFPPYGEHGFDGFEETLTESQKAVWADRKT